jgi:hypothetical protein
VMSLNPVALVAIGVAALGAAIVWVASKTEGSGNAWKHTISGAKLLFTAYVDTVKAQWNTVVNGFMIGIGKIQIAWYKFKNLIGVGDKSANNAEISKLNQDVEQRKELIKAGYKKVGSTMQSASAEFSKAYNSVKWKKESIKGDAKIADPALVGTDFGKGSDASSLGSPVSRAAAVKKSTESVATGGTKHNYITINLKELIGIKADTIMGNKETSNQAGNQVADELLRILAMATTATA